MRVSSSGSLGTARLDEFFDYTRLDPRLSTLLRVAGALGVTVSELIGEQPKIKGGTSHGTHKKKGRVVRRVSRRG